VPLRKIGRTGGDSVAGVLLADLRAAHGQALPAMLKG